MVERVLALHGGRNFRDLGGYPTYDGGRVRWRRIFRSGVMAYLTDQDHEVLRKLDIRLCCDLRDVPERKREPVDWRDNPIRQLSWDYQMSSHIQYPEGERFTPEDADQLILEVYRRLPYKLSRQYAGLFNALVEERHPLIFNCAAGKDRTGVAAALVLSSLGVVEEHLLDDYESTNTAVDLEQCLFANARATIGLGKDHEFMIRISRESRAVLIKADRRYIRASMEEIERRSGSINTYLANELGIDDSKLATLRANLLEN